MNEFTFTEMVAWLGFFSALFFAYFYYLRFRNNERMLLIEKNVDLSEIYKKSERHFPWYMVGFTLLGIGIGIIIFCFLYFMALRYNNSNQDQISVLTFFSTTLLFGGIGIIVGHSIEQKKKKLRG